mmetsp:Transcript_67500/g.197456  ORF Transcript_67500/g.197456 Transcript_67500/m.197456 type:complete len:206 (+) Transcript_67500:250-867(+)
MATVTSASSSCVSKSSQKRGHQSPLDARCGNLAFCCFLASSVWLPGTTCRPPVACVTGIRGTMPWTHSRPGLSNGFWSRCRPSVLGLQAGSRHQGRQAMTQSMETISSGVSQTRAKARFTPGQALTCQAPASCATLTISPVEGSFQCSQESASLRERPPFTCSRSCQRRSLAAATSSCDNAWLITTYPWLFKCWSHASLSWSANR